MMRGRDNDSETVDDEEDGTPSSNNEQGEQPSNDGDDDTVERPVTVSLTRAEALTLLHVAWEREIEMSSDPQTAGLAQLMGNVGTEVGKEIYGPEMTDWLEERQEKREEMVEEMVDQMGGVPGEQQVSGGKLGFQ